MRSVIMLFPSLVFVNAKLGLESFRQDHGARELSPRIVGAIHQDAFEKLGQKYSIEKPISPIDVIVDIVNIVSPYCQKGDSTCVSNIYETAVHEFHSSQNGRDNFLYPDSLDIEVRILLDELFSVVDSIDENNLDEVVNTLTMIEDELENLVDVDERSQLAGLASASVAIESSKLWHEAVSDTIHPLHDMIGYFSDEGATRKMQSSALDSSTIDKWPISKLVRPDVEAALASGMSLLNPIQLVNVLASSISASTSAAIISNPVVVDMNLYDRLR